MVVSAASMGMACVLRAVEVRVADALAPSGPLGLAVRAPRLAVFFLVCGLSLIGLPGTLGYCAEDLLFHGALESHPLLGVALPLATLGAGPPLPLPEVLVVDRLGLMGSWLAVADVVLMGGSFRAGGRELGGHNPLEPVRGGRPVVCGPDMANFAGLCERLERAGWLWGCADAPTAWEQALRLLAEPPALGPPPPLAGPSRPIAALVLERLP
jgi:hypothetical protein